MKSNILLIHCDQLRVDLSDGSNGGRYAGVLPSVATPALDRFRGEALSCVNASCSYPWCVPSRASFLTGLHPQQLRVLDTGCSIPEEVPTIAERLTPLGYECRAFGRTHRQHRGFMKAAEAHGAAAYGTTQLGSNGALGVFPGAIDEHHDSVAVSQFTRWLGERDMAQPFCTMVGFMAPHPPLWPPLPFAGRHDPGAVVVPTQSDEERPQHQAAARDHTWSWRGADEQRRAIAAYCDMVAFVDHSIGRVLAALDAAGLRASTTVAIISDHGEQLGEHGMFGKLGNGYQGSLAVPFLLRRGDGGDAGVVRSELVSLIDLVPSLLEAVDLPLPSELPGRSILAPGGHEYLFAGLQRGWMVRDRRWKLCSYQVDAGLAGELYNLVDDPGELHNRYQDHDCLLERARLAEVLLGHLARYPASPSRALEGGHAGGTACLPANQIRAAALRAVTA
ncbi:MAG: sulfatase-like hydrolase/transferase [Planctomycetota bacterium]|jgi:arylsulfatase A-like enzyme|nr:sulfatase-like hydrolase/transferase [Planctomycetota bacterium]